MLSSAEKLGLGKYNSSYTSKSRYDTNPQNVSLFAQNSTYSQVITPKKNSTAAADYLFANNEAKSVGKNTSKNNNAAANYLFSNNETKSAAKSQKQSK
ncbi:hypothetical protein ACS0TY_018871 [Phlomoides rotata]